MNPYRCAIELAAPDNFPYPPMMLYLLFPFFLLGKLLGIGSGGALPLQIPVLLADFLLLVILVRWKIKAGSRAMLFYWLSPVVIYINYVHGQLDGLPIAMLFLSSYYLFRSKNTISAVIFGLALATKTSIAIAVPFVIIYLWFSDRSLKKLIQYVFILVGSFLFVSLPFLLDYSMITVALQNSSQSKILDAYYSVSSGQRLYLIPAVYLLLLAGAVRLKVNYRDLLLSFYGFSFALILLFVSPMPGWYFWIIPFFGYFHTRDENISAAPFWALQLAYLAHFIDFESIALLESSYYRSLSLTVLQSLLAVNTYFIYLKGVKSFIGSPLLNRPFMLGIGGDSASGKSTLVANLAGVINPNLYLIVRGDDMHKWERGDEQWKNLTHLDPKSNFIYRETEHLTRLRIGKSIRRRAYDHGIGRFAEEKIIRSRRLIIFEGLLPFYLEKMRRIFDFKIFLVPDETLRWHRKIIRDTTARDYSVAKVLGELRKREKDAGKYMSSQMRMAELLILPTMESPIPDDKLGDESYIVNEHLIFVVCNSINVEPLIEKLRWEEIDGFMYEYLDNDKVKITFRNIRYQKAKTLRIIQYLFSDVEDFLKVNPDWHEDTWGICQLMVVYCLLQRAYLR